MSAGDGCRKTPETTAMAVIIAARLEMIFIGDVRNLPRVFLLELIFLRVLPIKITM